MAKDSFFPDAGVDEGVELLRSLNHHQPVPRANWTRRIMVESRGSVPDWAKRKNPRLQSSSPDSSPNLRELLKSVRICLSDRGEPVALVSQADQEALQQLQKAGLIENRLFWPRIGGVQRRAYRLTSRAIPLIDLDGLRTVHLKSKILAVLKRIERDICWLKEALQDL